MKKLILVINDHAKVGKSSFSAALNNYLCNQGFDSRLVGIIGNEDLHGQGANYDVTWNIIEDNDIETLFGLLEKHEAIVCDVETGDSAAVCDLYEKEDLDVVLGELDVELTVVTPEVEEAECHHELMEIAELFSDNADYVVARIPLDEFSSSLESWEASEACRVMDYMGAAVIEVPRVTDPVHDLLEQEELTLPAVLSMDTQELSDELVHAVTRWNHQFEQEISEAADFLHPEGGNRKRKLKIAG